MISPLPGYVLIEPLDDEEVTASGLALPEKAKEKPAKGKLIAIGTPLTDKDQIVYRELHVSHNITFHRWAGQDIKDEEKEYKLVQYKDLMGIYE